jgi:hypothetical protein
VALAAACAQRTVARATAHCVRQQRIEEGLYLGEQVRDPVAAALRGGGPQYLLHHLLHAWKIGEQTLHHGVHLRGGRCHRAVSRQA